MTYKNSLLGEFRKALQRRVEGEVRALVTPKRKRRIEEVVAHRSAAVVPVLEQVYDLGNISAILRTSEALGFHRVHIVRSPTGYRRVRGVTRGAHKWVRIRGWDSTASCLDRLRSEGYRIAATSMEGSVPLEEVDFSIPTAVVFGNEKEGASPEALASADLRIRVPMVGFSESFNVSVAAGVVLYEAHRQRREKGITGDLSAAEKLALEKRYTLLSSATLKRMQSLRDSLLEQL